MNFIKIRDNLLTKKECSDAIKWSCDNKDFHADVNKVEHSGYDYYDLMDIGEDPLICFDPVPLRPLFHAINSLRESYIKSFPSVKILDTWSLDYVRFKYWKPGEYYSVWHSEHGASDRLSRVLSFLIYLSDNDSQTEFMNHRNVRTKAGRGVIFPAYFTHTHRGSVCKKGLDRYIVSGYYSFL